MVNAVETADNEKFTLLTLQKDGIIQPLSEQGVTNIGTLVSVDCEAQELDLQQ